MTYRTPLTLLFAAGLALGGQARAEGTLHFANWSDYYPPELLKKFEKDTGIKATLDAYDSNETLLAKLKAGGGAYDVVVPSDSFIEIFVKEGLLQKLDKSQLPSLGNLKENFRTLGFDPGHDYSIPYLWGTTGYSYDTAKVPGGRLEESWKPFFEPPAELKGKVVALNSIEELFIPATYYLGIDECTEDAREAQKVLDLLLRQKPALAMYNSDGPSSAWPPARSPCTSSGTAPSTAPTPNAPASNTSIRRKASGCSSTTSRFRATPATSRKPTSSSTG